MSKYYEIVYMDGRWIRQYKIPFTINEVFRMLAQDWRIYAGKKQYAFDVVESNTDLTKLPAPTELI